MDIRSTIVSKPVEVVTTVLKDETIITLILAEREAKILGCLIGAMSPPDIENLISNKSMDFAGWLGKLRDREVAAFTGELYDSLYNLL